MNCQKNLKEFLIDRNNAISGKSGFDFCFNYFQSFKENGKIQEISKPENIENACAQLGQYLANWGMYRGSAFIKDNSMLIYKPLVEEITKKDWIPLWDLDVDRYNEQNIDLLIDFGNQIEKLLKGKPDDKASDTLKTKIMLGIFGNVPAFDQFFKTAFKNTEFKITTFNKNSILSIKRFYEKKDNKKIIDATTVFTYDFSTEKQTERKYTKAKLIDMIGFVEGQNLTTF